MEGIHVDWSKLALAVVLLGFPLPLSAAFWRQIIEANDDTRSIQLSAVFKPWQNWLDLIRAAVGAYILTALTFTVDDHVHSAMRNAALWQAGILTMGLLVQTIRFHHRVRFIGPTFYLSGLIPAVAGYIDGSFAVLVAWMFAFASRNLFFYFLALAVSLIVCAYFWGIDFLMIASVCLSLMPVILAALFQQRLLFLSKEEDRTDHC